MTRPTDDEMEIALQEARRMRDEGYDGSFMARSLLYLSAKDALAEKVVKQVRMFLKFGMSTEDLSHLRKAVEAWESFEYRQGGEAREETRYL